MPFSVPTHLSNPLRRFARRLVPDAAPEVAAPLPMPESLAGEPWFSVGRAVEALGGERVDGWILEEWRGLALRARESWLALGGRGDQACPCGSGKRYRNCCSRLVASAS